MLSPKVQNAEEILPKPLLRKLQRYYSVVVYIPKIKTRAQINSDRVRILHNQGLSPREIARKTMLSVKHIKRIIKKQEDGAALKPVACHKIYESVPEDIVEMVQRYVEGLIYVPSMTPNAVKRHIRVKRLLREGCTTTEIANCTGMSERRIWQLKAEHNEGTKNKKQLVRQKLIHDRSIQDILNVTMAESTAHAETHPMKCCTCRNLFRPHESSCIICDVQSTNKKSYSDTIIIHRLPYAIMDRDI